MSQDIDHLFLFIQPGGPEVDALRCLGLTETYRRAHPGQGTANVCFAFDNLYLELIWATDEAELRSPTTVPTRLWERSQWHTSSHSPFGVAVRGELPGVRTWDYRPVYLPGEMSIQVALDSQDAALPLVFVSPEGKAPAEWPADRRGQLQAAGGWGRVVAVELVVPPGTANAPLLKALNPSQPKLAVRPQPYGQHQLRLALADPSGRHTHTLDLASTRIGQWRVTLHDKDRPTRSWRRAWAALGLTAPHGLAQRLLNAWAEPHRHYHTTQHLRECLALLEPALSLARRPGEVELALWFHDAVYDPQGKDNEARSADWACEALAQAGASPETQQRVRALIMATCHNAQPADPDARLLVDIDLAILGADPARFSEYEAQVRAEYRRVPGWLYRSKRSEVLAAFLARPAIYGTAQFRQRFEERARGNLGGAGE